MRAALTSVGWGCFFFLLAVALWGCQQPEEEEVEHVVLHCTLSLPDAQQTELDEKLSSAKDAPIRKALEDYLAPVFQSSVHDIELSFFDRRKRGERTLHLVDVLDASEKDYPFEIAPSDYRFGGGANLSANPGVSLTGGETEKDLAFVQKDGTSDSHRAGLFSMRGRLYVPKGTDTEVSAPLCMNNACATLILNCDSCDVVSVRATVEGLADTFYIVDSLYSFDRHTVINADVIDLAPYIGSDQVITSESSPWGYDPSWITWTKTPLMICAVGFPSRSFGTDVINGKVIIWTVNLFVTMADGSVTRNDIYMGQPVQANKLKIVKGWLMADGSFEPTPPLTPTPGPGGGGGTTPPTPPSPDDSVVGVSVTLNWGSGSSFTPDL